MRFKGLLAKRSHLFIQKFNLSTFENRYVAKLLEERGLLTGIFPNKSKALEDLYIGSKQTIYCGFDPTAASLHIGNLLAIIVLIHHQRAGHSPIALVGSATALIGDPSGKATERKALDQKVVAENSNSIENSIRKIFENHANYIWKRKGSNYQKDLKLPELQVLNNIKWFENINVIQFLSKFGYHLRMSDLLSRKQIQTRLSNEEGISYTEFSYQILQAYDWLHMLEKHNCNLQLGGNDQTGNITTGFELIDKIKPNHKCFGLTLPLLTNKAGEKLGKSAGNAVWLCDKMLSSFEFYQYFLNTSDQMVETYLKLFTFLPKNEINDLMEKHKKAPHNYAAQQVLAEQITVLVRGEAGLNSAIKSTKALFLSDIDSLNTLSDNEIDSTFKEAKKCFVTWHKDLTLLDLVVELNEFSSVDDAINGINLGIRVNTKKYKDPTMKIETELHILKNNITLVRIGKKKFYLVKWFQENN